MPEPTVAAELTVAEYLTIHWNRKYGGSAKAAKAFGVSPSFLSAIAHGKKNPTPAILSDAGLELKVVQIYPLVEREQPCQN